MAIPASVRTRQWQLRNPEKYRINIAKTNARRKADGSYRNWYLKDHYGITLNQWNELLIKQSGRCAICEKPQFDLDTDHDHMTGKVRGLLCHLCNIGLGSFNDQSEYLLKAAKYVNS